MISIDFFLSFINYFGSLARLDTLTFPETPTFRLIQKRRVRRQQFQI